MILRLAKVLRVLRKSNNQREVLMEVIQANRSLTTIITKRKRQARRIRLTITVRVTAAAILVTRVRRAVHLVQEDVINEISAIDTING